MHGYKATELVEEEILDHLNERFLAEKGLRIETDDELDPYTRYAIYRGEELLFTTIYPKELLIKVAQLLPGSEVRVASHAFTIGDEAVSQETLEIALPPA